MRALPEESICYIASGFQVLQNCDARKFAGEFHVTDHPSSAVFMSQSFRCGSHKFIAFNIVSKSQIDLHIFITFRVKIVTNTNKLLYVVTLRHSSRNVSNNDKKWNFLAEPKHDMRKLW